MGVGGGVDVKCLRCGRRRRRRRRSSERFSWKKLGTWSTMAHPVLLLSRGGKVDGRDGV